jgi:hypothetical protein
MKKASKASVNLALVFALGMTAVLISGCRVTGTPHGVRVRARTPRLYVGPVVRVRKAPPPPPRRRARRNCPPGSYWKRGAYKWHGNRWVWHRGGCKAIPRRYRRRRCRYQPGRWVRVRGGYRRRRGRWVCR